MLSENTRKLIAIEASATFDGIAHDLMLSDEVHPDDAVEPVLFAMQVDCRDAFIREILNNYNHSDRAEAMSIIRSEVAKYF